MLLQHLMADQLATEIKINSLKAILSPIKKVPGEVMSIIFECCVLPFAPETFMDVDELRPRYRRPVAPPLVLSQVCRSWRDLALSLPKLWSNIEACITQGPYMGISSFVHSAEKQTNIVAHYVKHSKSCPLACKVQIEASQEALLTCQNTIKQLLGLLAAQSNRWRSMTLSFPGEDTPISPILESIQGDLTCLRFLKISREKRARMPFVLFPAGAPVPLDHSPMLLGNAPMLVGLHFYGTSFSPSVVRWTQLKDLSIDQPIDYRIDAISNCKNLEKLSLAFSFLSQDISSTTLITFPKLQILAVHACGNTAALNSLLASFTVPQLRMLSITTSDHTREVQLAPFLHRLSRPLEALEIDISSVDPIILVEWLRLVPSLRELSFGIRSILTHEMTHSLAPNGDEEFICPSLIRLRANFRCSLSSLVDMMEKRWSLGPSPKILVVNYWSTLSGEDGERFVSREATISRFKSLCKEGLEFSFKPNEDELALP